MFGALLLIAAIAFGAAGIIGSSQQPATRQGHHHKFLLRFLVFIALVYHCLTVFATLATQPGTNIDVYIFQTNSAAALLHGIDPYTLTTTNIYGRGTPFYAPELMVGNQVKIGFPYPPASLFFVLPAYLVGDIRYAYVFAVVATVVLLLVLRTNLTSAAVTCLLLLHSVTRFVERQSWTEPLVLLTLTCTLYAAVKKRWWLPIALGIFFASKQYSVLALPFVPLLLEANHFKEVWKLLAQSLAITGALTLPMALWNFAGFWRNVVLFQIRQPFRKDALTIGNLLFPVHPVIIIGSVVVGMIFAMRKARPHPSMFAVCYGFILTIFVSTNKQAFCNYYFLTIYTLLLGAATASIPLTRETFCTTQLTSESVSRFKRLSQDIRAETNHWWGLH